MAPRIRNISADEFRRLFQAPEIQSPGLTTSDAINLSAALEQKQRGEEEKRLRIAKIERAIAEEEAKAQDIQQESQLGSLLSTPAQAPETIQTPEGPVPTPGPIESIEQNIAEAERQQEIGTLRTQLDPLGQLEAQDKAEVEEKKNQTKLNNELTLIRARAEEQRKIEGLRQAGKTKEAEEKKTALDKEFMNSTKNEAAILVNEIDRAMPKISAGTTGIKAQLTKGVAGTDARKLATNLDSIKAIVGFAKLQEMRNNSKTGGALGQVSERENILLQSSRGSLDQLSGPDELKQTLGNIKDAYNNVLLIIETKNIPGFDELSDAEQLELFELKKAQRGK